MLKNIKSLIKMFVPPIVTELNEKLFFSNQSRHFFGTFNSFNEIKNENPWIDEEGWIKISKLKLDNAISSQQKVLPLGYNAGLGCLVFIVNHLSMNNINHTCNVLDFGGGTGFIYHVIKNGFMNPAGVMWHVVDCDRLCYLGSEYKEQKDNIQFYDFNGFKSINCDIDILYINTSLQYINDYKEFFDSTINTQKYIVLTRFLAGDNPTFITSQNVHGKITPCIILNKNEVVNYFAEKGFRLIFESQCEEFSGFFDNSVPLNLRIPYDINLIFENCKN
jgi:putative methyltransferase (TIGR04325 family)